MKFTTFIILLLLAAGSWYISQTPLGTSIVTSVRSWVKGGPNPKRELDEMAKHLPSTLRPGEPVTEVSTYIQKTEEPFDITTGYLSFVGVSHYEFVFTWETDHWVFTRFMLRNPDIDITKDPEGQAIMNTPEMVVFLYPYRNPLPSAATAQNSQAATAPAAARVAPVIPQRTPTPQEKALEIARKYASPR